MAITRYNPRRELGLWNDSLFDPWLNTGSLLRSMPKQTYHWWENKGDRALLELNLAGFDKEEVSVSLRKNKILHVSAERGENNKFSSNYSLPQDAMPDTLTARLDRGILTIEVLLENSERQIEIL